MGLIFRWQIRKIPSFRKCIEEKIRNLIGKLGMSSDDELGIMVCGDKYIRSLNKEFCGKDAITDILSFPMDNIENHLEEEGKLGVRIKAHRNPLLLGDVVVNLSQVRRQANRNKNSEEDEFFAVCCHGILHLLGLDHHRKADYHKMSKLERKIFEYFKVEVENFGH